MAWDITNIAGLGQAMQADGVPYPVTGQQATGSQSGFTASQADLAVAAGATTNTSNFNCGGIVRSFKAAVFLSGVTAGATPTLTLALQCSSSATFASDVENVDVVSIPVTVTGQLYSLTLSGFAYDTARQFVRVSFVTGAGTSATADVGVIGV